MMDELLAKLSKYTDYQNGISKERINLLLEDITLDNFNFKGYDINYSEFLEVIFNNCDFSTVYMSGASLCGSTFNNCLFYNNIFKKGKADNVKFINSDLNVADTFRTSFCEATFEHLQIADSKLVGSWFDSANFSNVKFIKTDLSEADFSNSNFVNVTFENCFFDKTKFNNILGIENIQFINSSILIDGEIISKSDNEIIKLF